MDSLIFTILSLGWVVIIYILTDSDKKIQNLLSRTKITLAIDGRGHVLLSQSNAMQNWGILEVLEFGKGMNTENPEQLSKKNTVNRFKSFYDNTNIGRTIIEILIFSLTAHAFIYLIVNVTNYKYFYIHASVLFVCSYVYCLYVKKSESIKFITFNGGQ